MNSGMYVFRESKIKSNIIIIINKRETLSKTS
jgi:hypothetical protein